MKTTRTRSTNPFRKLIASTKFCKVINTEPYIPSIDVMLVSKSNLQRNSVKHFENMCNILHV